MEEPRVTAGMARTAWCFNGATAMKPWKSNARDRQTDGAISMLQWGHGDEAVEERRLRRPSVRVSQLQWGHGDEAVEEAQSV